MSNRLTKAPNFSIRTTFGMVDFVHFRFTNQTSNDFFSAVNGSLVARVDRYVSFFVDINLNSCFSDDFIDSFSTLPMTILDLVHINLDRINFSSCWSQFWTNFRNRCFNHIKDFKTRFGLSQSFCQDFCSNPFGS